MILYSVMIRTMSLIEYVNIRGKHSMLIIHTPQYINHKHPYNKPYTYYNSPQQQLNHLEWLLNGTVFMNGTVGATPLQLLINPVTLAHAGLWECRAVLSDGTTSSSANAGTLTVYGEHIK